MNGIRLSIIPRSIGLTSSSMKTVIFDQAAPMATVRLAYGDAEQQFGDLRLPDGPHPWPLVILIHGGYWRSRYDLGYLGHAAAALTELGYATWNIEYRRLGDADGGWPGTFLDVAAGADFMRSVAKLLPVDLKRIVVLGHSAGAQLALWLAGRHHIPTDSPLYQANPLSVHGVVSLAGVCDLQRAWELGLSDAAVAELLGGSPQRYPERYAATSPAALVPLGVRQAVLHGSEDEDVPLVMSTEYADHAAAHGDKISLVTLEGADHFALVDPYNQDWSQVTQWVGRLSRKMRDE